MCIAADHDCEERLGDELVALIHYYANLNCLRLCAITNAIKNKPLKMGMVISVIYQGFANKKLPIVIKNEFNVGLVKQDYH